MDFHCGGKSNASLLFDKLDARSSIRQVLVDRSFSFFLGLGIVTKGLNVSDGVALSQSNAEVSRNAPQIAADVKRSMKIHELLQVEARNTGSVPWGARPWRADETFAGGCERLARPVARGARPG